MIAGEASGDALGGPLIRALKKRNIEVTGIGGHFMEAEGLKSLLPMDQLCVMGLFEVIKHLPRLLKLMNAVVLEIEKANPDVVVTIDLPDFNFRVAKMLKKRGRFQGKIVHYVAPSVWAWRPKRAEKVAQFLDGMMCLFPFEPKFFEPHGLNAVYVGHPLIVNDHTKKCDDFRELYNLQKDSRVVGIYLGSRVAEIQKHKDIFRDLILFLKQQDKTIEFLVPSLPDMQFNALRAMSDMEVCPIVLNDEQNKWDVMRACDMAIAVSGTVGLELSYMNIPHVVMYKANFWTGLIVRLVIKTRFVHLANIILDKGVVPEFLQGRCSSLFIATELAKMIKDPEVLNAQKASFEELRETMKDGLEKANPSDHAANFLLNI